MGEEKYVLNCPRCGPVEGIVPGRDADERGLPEGEVIIEEEVVQTAGGTTTRVRCPRCGGWVKPDRVRPA